MFPGPPLYLFLCPVHKFEDLYSGQPYCHAIGFMFQSRSFYISILSLEITFEYWKQILYRNSVSCQQVILSYLITI